MLRQAQRTGSDRGLLFSSSPVGPQVLVFLLHLQQQAKPEPSMNPSAAM